MVSIAQHYRGDNHLLIGFFVCSVCIHFRRVFILCGKERNLPLYEFKELGNNSLFSTNSSETFVLFHLSHIAKECFNIT
jgi:hypothetical protein